MCKKANTNKPATIPFSTAEELKQFAAIAAQRTAINREYEALKARAAATLAGAPMIEETAANGAVKLLQAVTIDGWTLQATTHERAAYEVPAGTSTRYAAKQA